MLRSEIDSAQVPSNQKKKTTSAEELSVQKRVLQMYLLVRKKVVPKYSLLENGGTKVLSYQKKGRVAPPFSFEFLPNSSTRF